jgi:hypothetical protein
LHCELSANFAHFGLPSTTFNLSEISRLFSVIRVYDDAGNVIDTHEHTRRVLKLALGSTHFDVPATKSGFPTKADNTQSGLVEFH